MNIIEKRDKMNKHRRKMKDQYDSMMTLSVTAGEWVPLLQEGMVMYGDGSPWFYICRGTLKQYYENLSSDYEGSINIGHTDMATFPERIVGRWKKENLRLVDIGDGRQRLETNLPLNMEHPLVQALKQAEFDMGLSVEMSAKTNWDLTRDKEKNPFCVQCVDNLFIYDYAIVGNAGDVNSMGVQLKGEVELKKNNLAKLLSKEGGNSIADITKLMDAMLSNAEAEEEETDGSEEAEGEESEEEHAEDGGETEETEETEEEEAEEGEGESSEETEEEEGSSEQTLASMMAPFISELADLRAENKSLKKQLAAMKKSESDFVKKFKKLSVSLSSTQKKQQAVEHKEVYTDGIGE